MGKKIKSFVNLIAWKKSHQFVLDIYKITKKLLKNEKYSLVDQMRRAAVSITSNIAEGFYRRTANDKSHFYFTSLGSLAEIQNQLLIAKDLKYIEIFEFKVLAFKSIEIRKLLNGLMKSSFIKS
ncbi:MAG: S23 ribosomal protein [Candidatus Roizmanbacteria bacterium GW2011_GWC2_35_12]|uniref:S23 ribosomal protein n=1 Tax=Candidatus Roizmanbacteria bacterium GW2011_GWC2_35_12 TaxID=1618485 RepID=A0A0G0B8R9_9BACT|nr:MAG: S23 ribosomal protein [Candidatus Roizmanbacteria bacterium GW2011_GWC2_35_12]